MADMAESKREVVTCGSSNTESAWRLTSPRISAPIRSGSCRANPMYGATWLAESRSHMPTIESLMFPTSRYVSSRGGSAPLGLGLLTDRAGRRGGAGVHQNCMTVASEREAPLTR